VAVRSTELAPKSATNEALYRRVGVSACGRKIRPRRTGHKGRNVFEFGSRRGPQREKGIAGLASRSPRGAVPLEPQTPEPRTPNSER